MVVFTGSTVEEAIQKGLKELDIPRMKAHIKVISREKKGFLGLFGKKPAQVDIEAISETTVVKANQQVVKGVPKKINDLNEPVKTVSEETVDLGHVVNAIKKIEEEGQGISDEVKAEILKHERHASTILEETGHIEILNELQIEEAMREEAGADDLETEQDQTENQDLKEMGLKVEQSYDIAQVATDVTAYVQAIVDDMDVEATLSNDYNRRSINLQIDTNEPGRIIGYHGKVLKALQLLAQNYLYNRYSKTFYVTINVNDYVEHRAEVLQTYAQKLANRVLEEGRSHKTDPMSNSERKIIHRIISRMDGVTSYSEGDEPNRYVVVDTEEEVKLMLNKIRDYLDFSGLQYRSPDKAGAEREKMLAFRHKGQEARKAFTELAKAFQASHPEWQLQQTSQWMNQAQRLRPHFWVYLQRDGQVTEPMMALRLYGTSTDFGISLEVSFIERKKDEQTLGKQAKVLDIPTVKGIYYLTYSNGQSQRWEANEEKRRTLREKVRSQEVRKVLVKVDVPMTENSSEEEIVEGLLKSYSKILPYYLATRK